MESQELQPKCYTNYWEAGPGVAGRAVGSAARGVDSAGSQASHGEEVSSGAGVSTRGTGSDAFGPDGTAEWKQAGVAIQPSLRDWAVFLRCPGVETLVITQIYDELILAALISVRPSFRGSWARWKSS